MKNKMFPLSFPNRFFRSKSEGKTSKLNTKGLLYSLTLPGYYLQAEIVYYTNSKSNIFL